MSPLAASTFVQATLAAMLVIPVMILWVVAVVDVVRQGGSGLRIAAVLVLILVVPILGPILYFVFARRPAEPQSVEQMAMADADLRAERARAPIGGTSRVG
jgi:hypothetical protein